MPKIALNVGWGTVTIDEIHFNFRLHTDTFAWEEIVEYSSLAILDETVRQSFDILTKIDFPVIDEGFQALIVENQSPGRSSSMDFFQLLEKQRKYIETWIICIFDNIAGLTGESREWIKQLYFRSVEKLVVFDQLCGVVSVSPSKKQLIISNSNRHSIPSKQSNGNGSKTTETISVNNGEKSPAGPITPVQRKSIYTKVTHKIFKKRSKSNAGELNESNLQENTTSINNHSHEDTRSANSSKPPTIVTIPSNTLRGNSNASPVSPDKITPKSARSDSTTDSAKTTGGKSGKRFSLMKGMSFKNNANTSSKLTALDEDEEEQLVCAVFIDVQRGGSEEIRAGVLSYDISFRVVNHKTNKAVMYRTMQRYNNFKTLYDSLMDVSGGNSSDGSTRIAAGEQDMNVEQAARAFSNKGFMELLDTPFPIKTTWFALTDSELSERTRCLDAWLREVCIHYRRMPAAAKQAVRTFLNFDMSQQKDIFVLDQLCWGVIDIPLTTGLASPVLIMQRSALESMSEDFVNQLETMSNMDGVTPTPSVRNSVQHVQHSPARNTHRQSLSFEINNQLHHGWENSAEGIGGITPPGRKYTVN